jgi:hypothetical protein
MSINGPEFSKSLKLNTEWQGTPEGEVMFDIVTACFKGCHGGTWPVADFILNLYNSNRPVCLSLLCSQTNPELFNLALNALKIRRKNGEEPQEYFVDGDNVMKALCKLYHRDSE